MSLKKPPTSFIKKQAILQLLLKEVSIGKAIKERKFKAFYHDDINEDFFSNWSPEMAWVLGILFTDGFVRPFSISLWSMDIELLEKVKNLLNSLNPIGITTQSYDKSKHIYRFAFYRQKMMEDLNRLGMHQRKSLNMTFPDVPQEYMRHFVRGCWDGDGSIYFEEPAKIRASYTCGSLKFIERLVQELYKIGIYKRKILLDKTDTSLIRSYSPVGRYPLTIHKEKRSKSYYIKIDSRENLEKLFDYFYDRVVESMYLERKFKIFAEGLRVINNRLREV